MIFKRCLMVYLLIGVLRAFSPDSPFVQQTNTYRRTITDRILPHSLPGYVELVRVTLPEISKGTLDKSFLNNFKIGLDQYYLFRLYEKLDSELLTRTPSFKRIGYPVSLPNIILDADTFFHDVQVHGFPSFEKNIYLYVEPSPNAEDQRFKIDFHSTSEKLTFKGYFTSANSSTTFEYQTLTNVFRSNVTKVRAPDGAIVYVHVNETFQYADHHLSPTTNATDSLSALLAHTMQTHWLPKLAQHTYARIQPTLLLRSIKYAEMYRKLILLSIIENSVEYISKNNLSLELNSLNIADPRGAPDIKLVGLLNFSDFKLTNFTWEEISGDRLLSRMTDTLTLYYQEEKPCFISFNATAAVAAAMESDDALRVNVTPLYRVKNVSITAIYTSVNDERPLRVFSNESGFLINFGLEELDPSHEVVITHVGYEIGVAIYNTVNKLFRTE